MNTGKQITIRGVTLSGLKAVNEAPRRYEHQAKTNPGTHNIDTRTREFRRYLDASTTAGIHGLESWLRGPVEGVAKGNFEICGGSEAIVVGWSSESNGRNVFMPKC